MPYRSTWPPALQLVFPFVFGMCPLMYGMMFMFLHLGVPGYTIYVSAMIAWVPAINPLVTFCLVRPYRWRLGLFLRAVLLCGAEHRPAPASAGHSQTVSGFSRWMRRPPAELWSSSVK